LPHNEFVPAICTKIVCKRETASLKTAICIAAMLAKLVVGARQPLS